MSDAMKAKEQFIIRRVGNLTCHQLRSSIRRDLRDLVAYTHATALDGSPSIRKRARIGLIRLICPMQINGQQQRRVTHIFYQGVGFVARGGIAAMLRPYGLLALALVLGWLGIPPLVALIRKSLGLP
jgi:hypothetical protein